ncbi:MAG: carboxylesterase family protein [Acetobacteraceae bacterium]|nr:carboxylesterase family protein [Acetobacteraceae bacterium]
MSETVRARCALGELAGARGDGVARFRAVPYAAPPVGPRRFAPPEPPARWGGARDATRPGPIAPQPPSRLRAAMGDFTREQSESCLTLDITTPAPDGARRPVVVWLHGGAFLSGAGSLGAAHRHADRGLLPRETADDPAAQEARPAKHGHQRHRPSTLLAARPRPSRRTRYPSLSRYPSLCRVERARRSSNLSRRGFARTSPRGLLVGQLARDLPYWGGLVSG